MKSTYSKLICLHLAIFIWHSTAFSAERLLNVAAQQVVNYSDDNSQVEFRKLLTKQERRYLEAQSSLTVCNIAIAQGFDNPVSVDLVKVMVDKMGIDIKASSLLSWQQGLEQLAKKECDILPWATATVERQKTMNFTLPYTRGIRIIIAKRTQPYIVDINDFDDKIFATERSNNVLNQLKQQYPNILTVRTNHTLDMLHLIKEEKVFAGITSIYSIANIFKNEDFSDLQIAGRLPESFDDIMSLATRKDELLLNSILNKAVKTTLPKQIKKFMNNTVIFQQKPSINYTKLWIISALTLSSIILLVFWNRHLRLLNKKLEKTKVKLQLKTKELEILSVTDPLTKAFNRLKIDSVFTHEIERSERYNQALSIIMIDIDYFKKVNDDFGHLAGDQVLSAFSLLISKNLRNSDLLGRWGGEEFLAICPSTTEADVEQVAEKLRIAVESASFPYIDKLTASFGVAQRLKGDSQEMLTARADRALYLSKNNGRNKVSITTRD